VATSTAAWLLPEEPAPVRLMNTIWADTRGVHDELTSPAVVHEWLTAVTDHDDSELGDTSEHDLADALLLRDSLRRLAAYTTDDERPSAQSPVTDVEEAIAVVNAVIADSPHTQLALRDGQLHAINPPRTSPTRSALAQLGQDAVALLTGPTAVKLRACNAPGCVLYFVKTHPRREWCSEGCGNRVRAARHYQRTRERNT
jgi:predicted RNA-binding Zn ribbon-like protein